MLTVNYIDYDYQTTLGQDVVLSVTCDAKHVLRVVCGGSVVYEKPICEKPGTHQYTIRIAPGHTRCEFRFFDAEGKKLITKRIIRIKPIDKSFSILNARPSTFLANTFIMSGDYNVNRIPRSQFHYGGISLSLYYSIAGVITMTNTSNKPATAVFCAGGACIPMFIQYQGNKLRLAFAVNLDQVLADTIFIYGGFDYELSNPHYYIRLYTPDYDYTRGLVRWINEAYNSLYDERVLSVTRKVKCEVKEYLTAKSHEISVIYTEGDVVADRRNISGNGYAILTLKAPVENKLYVFLNNNAVAIDAVYYVGVGIPYCTQEMEPIPAK